MSEWSLRSRLRDDGLVRAVLAVTAVALLVRLAFLGVRVAHQDEARVGYWTIRYLVSGRYEYRAIVHGPFLPIVNRHLFALFGPSDVVMRLVVALVGGLAPLAALLFRQRLRDSEVGALAAILAANPVLVYYSRFMRQDVPLAVFMLVALGLFVRAWDSEDARWTRRYLIAGTAFFGLAFTTKENALVYPLCWAGAMVLLLDHRLLRAHGEDRSPWGVVVGLIPSVDRTRTAVRRWGPTAALLVVEFLAIVVFFYAPRGGGYPLGSANGVGLWSSIGSLDPVAFARVVEEALLGSWHEFLNVWGSSDHRDHPYVPYLRHYLDTLGAGALVTSAFALVGFIADRYGPDGPRDLVALGAYWGAASIVGYPYATDIQAAWSTVHAIVPLAIPAAVGLAMVYRAGSEALADDDPPAVAITALLLLLVVGYSGLVVYDTSFANPQSRDNQLVQYAQSSSTDLKPVLNDVSDVAPDNEGVDVLYYGSEFYTENESDHDQPPAGPGWFGRLPLAWYFEGMEVAYGDDFNVSTTESVQTVRTTDAPVVVALGKGSFDAGDLTGALEGYSRWDGHRYLYDTGTISSITIFVDTDRVDDPATVYDGVVERFEVPEDSETGGADPQTGLRMWGIAPGPG